MPTYYALILYPLAVLFTLGAVALGGFLVWKTRRDSGDKLFGARERAEVFNTEEPWEKEDFPVPEEIETPEPTARAALRYRKQKEEEELPKPKIAEGLGKGSNSES